MSEVIDSKVVELKFNNKEFENNVKTSLSTIDKLKKSLNFDNVTKGVTTLNSALNLVSLKGISNQVGELVKLVDTSVSPIEAAVSTIGSAITNTIGGAINGVVSQIQSGGMSRAFNIEAAKFSLQGLGIEWDSVTSSINNAVSGTAYGLDQAAKAAAVLSASGIGVENVTSNNGDQLPELERDLKAVSGIAAQTGQDFDRIADVFSTIANNGKVMTMQVRQFSTYGLNATADLAKYYGVATSDIEGMLQGGEISADEFFDMMYSKYWKNAEKANETVTGVESNIKAALGRIGAAFISPIIENKGPLNQFLNAYMDAINAIAGKLKQIGSVDENGNDIAGKLTSYVDKHIIKYLNQLTDWLKDFTERPNGLLRVWRSVYRFLKGTFKVLQSLIRYLTEIGQAFNRAFPKGLPTYLLRLAKKWTEFTNAIFKNAMDSDKSYKRFIKFRAIWEAIGKVLHAVRSVIKAVFRGLKKYLDELNLDPLGILAEAFKYIGNLFNGFKAKAKPFYNIFKAIGTIIGVVVSNIIAFGQAVVEVFQAWDFHPIEFLGKVLKTLTKGWDTNSKSVNRSKNFYKIFLNIIAAVAKVLGFVILVVAKVINIFGKLVGTVVTLLSPLGSLITKIVEFGKELGKNIIDKVTKAGGPLDKLKSIFDKIKDVIDGVKTAFENTIDSITTEIDNIDVSKYTNITKVIEDIQNFFSGIVDAARNALDSITDFFNFKPDTSEGSSTGIIDTILTGLDNVAGFAISARKKIQKLVSKITDTLSPALENVKDLFGSAFGQDTQDDISDTNEKLTETGDTKIFSKISKLLKKLKDFFIEVGDKLKLDELFSNISDALLEQMDLDEDADTFDVILGSIGIVAGFISDAISIIITKLNDAAKTFNDAEDIQKLLKEVGKWLIKIDIFAVAMALWNLGSSLKNLTQYLADKNELTLYSRVTGFMDSIGSFLVTFSLSLLSIVGSLALLVGVLSYADKNKVDIGEAEKILAIMAAVMLVVALIGQSSLSNKTTQSVKWEKGKGKTLEKQQDSITAVSKLLLAFSVSMVVMAKSFEIITKTLATAKKKGVEPKQVEKVMGMFLGFIVAIILLLGIMEQVSQIISGTSGETTKYSDKGRSKKTFKGQKSEGFEKTIRAMARVLEGVALALGVMTVAFWAITKVVSKTKPEDLNKTIGIMAGMMVALAGIMIVAGIAGNIRNKNKKDIDKFSEFAESGILIAFAAALGLMTICFKTIIDIVKGVSIPTIKGAGAIMGVMALALAGIITLITKLPRTYSQNAIFSQGILGLDMVAFAGSLELMAEAFKTIIGATKGRKAPAIAAAAVIMGLMALCLGGIIGEIAFLNKTPMSVESILSEGIMALDMAAFALSVKEMAKAFKIMIKAITTDDGSMIDETAVNTVSTVFIAMMGALALMLGEVTIAGALSQANPLAEIVAGVVSAFDMWAFGTCVKSLAKTFSDLIGDKDIKDLDEKEVVSLADMFGTVVSALAIMLNSNNLTLLTTAIGALAGGLIGTGVGAGVGTAIAVGAGIGALVGELVEWIDGNILIDNIKELMTVFGDFVSDMKTEFPDVSAEDISYYGSAFGDILNGYAAIINSNNTDILGKIGKAIADFVSSIAELLTGENSIDEAQQKASDIIKNFTDFVDVFKDDKLASTDINRYANAFSAILNAYAEFANAITSFNVEYGTWDEENLNVLTSNIQELMKSFKDSTLDLLKISVADYQTIKEANDINQAEAYKASWTSKAELEMEKAGQSNTNAYTDVLEDSASSTETLANLKSVGDTTADNTINALTDAFEKPEIENRIKSIGTSISEGISEGLTETASKTDITKSSLSVINWSLDAMASKQGADINSPSKKFKKKIGKGIIEGISAGFESYKSDLEESAKNVVNDLVGSFTSAKDQVSDLMNFNTDDFKITPVVDLSNVQSATGDIQSLFSDQSMNLDTNVSSITDSLNQIQNQDPNADLMSAIDGLKDNINNNYTNYTVNGVTYDDGSNVASAVQSLISATNIQRRM